MMNTYIYRMSYVSPAVCKWEKNTCYPDIIFLPHLARILNCTTDDFFEIHGGDANE